MAASSRRVLLVGCGALAFALAACDALLGLDAYQNVACNQTDCPDVREGGTVPPPNDSGAEADVTNPFEGGLDADAGSEGAVEAGPPSDAGPPVPTASELWAHWPMPNPDAAIGPESSTPLPNQMAYDAGPDGGGAIVYDLVTKLAWSRPVQGTVPSYEQAWTLCSGLSGSWRVPTRIELVSLVDFTQPDGKPTIDPAAFPTVLQVRTWTSSTVAGDDSPSGYWVVDFSTGLTDNTGSGLQVLCVNGGSP